MGWVLGLETTRKILKKHLTTGLSQMDNQCLTKQAIISGIAYTSP